MSPRRGSFGRIDWNEVGFDRVSDGLESSTTVEGGVVERWWKWRSGEGESRRIGGGQAEDKKMHFVTR